MRVIGQLGHGDLDAQREPGRGRPRGNSRIRLRLGHAPTVTPPPPPARPQLSTGSALPGGLGVEFVSLSLTNSTRSLAWAGVVGVGLGLGSRAAGELLLAARIELGDPLELGWGAADLDVVLFQFAQDIVA